MFSSEKNRRPSTFFAHQKIYGPHTSPKEFLPIFDELDPFNYPKLASGHINFDVHVRETIKKNETRAGNPNLLAEKIKRFKN